MITQATSLYNSGFFHQSAWCVTWWAQPPDAPIGSNLCVLYFPYFTRILLFSFFLHRTKFFSVGLGLEFKCYGLVLAFKVRV